MNKVLVKEWKFSEQVKKIVSSHVCLKIQRPVDFFVAIPTLADEGVFDLVESLLTARIPEGRRIAVAVLINDSEDASDEVKRKNDKILETLKHYNGVYVRVLRNIPRKMAGVGFARRILMDEAMCVFARELAITKSQSSIEFFKEKFIFSLDSDCVVSPDYFEKAYEFLTKTKADFGVFFFEHRLSQEPKLRVAGALWELFLRYWRDSLRIAGYSSAFYPIGSLFVFRGYLYPVVGGMNLRKAGEDFYFLQKVLNSFKVIDIPAFVFPKAEPSLRTPFGTGYEIRQYISGNESRLRYVWDYRAFELVGKAIRGEGTDEFLGFLESNPKYRSQFENIRRHSGSSGFEKNFVRWFNPFKVLKFLRYLERVYPRSQIELEVQKLIRDMNEKGLLDSELFTEFLEAETEASFEAKILKFLNVLRKFDLKMLYL